MSHNSELLSELICEDDDFLQKIDKDILFFLENSLKNRRFLIHKVCEKITASQPRPLSTFSIGAEEHRRTVICHRHQLRVDLSRVTLNRNKEAEYTWRYVKRNSELKHKSNDYRSKCDMGVETAFKDKSGKSPSSESTIDDKSASPLTTEENSSSEEAGKLSSKRSLFSRTRRPDRAVYIPRAKRSQTTPPTASSKNKCEKTKSKSIDEKESNLEEYPTDKKFHSVSTRNDLEYSESCEIPRKCELLLTTDTKNCQALEEINGSKTNIFNSLMMTEQAKNLTIESAGGIVNVNKVDKDEKELIKASQEINRSNRKLIKQTFNSNVLEIETASALARQSETKTSENDDDDWDTMFDDNGDCLDPKMLEELTVAVGKVNIETPKTNYKAYQANVDLLSLEEFPHVLECSNFPVEFRDQDLIILFSEYKQSGFEIKWVDDTHCLVVFSSAKIAAEVLTMSHSFIRMKPLKEATTESRTKAKKCANSLQPYKQRPETCAALAKRLVSGALGVRVKATSEEREKERKVLREAKERKILEKKQREDMWNN